AGGRRRRQGDRGGLRARVGDRLRPGGHERAGAAGVRGAAGGRRRGTRRRDGGRDAHPLRGVGEGEQHRRLPQGARRRRRPRGRREPPAGGVREHRALQEPRRHPLGETLAYTVRGPVADPKARNTVRKAQSMDVLWSIVQVAFQILLGITSLLLTLLILLHKGRGGGLSDMFGGGTTSNLGASGVAERNLNRITV